ncbi:MAG TPA: 3-phosphoshikimate 1-carboxyvinyltransferase [Candidatus Nitrosocosmicus sp.]|nr:3-phosphoshikimate 1-carboxyvinyltransferase [Candidatus Nitrosocosmicus sp.]
MEVKVKKSQISGEINCPPSKSYSHRAILISALASGRSHIKNVLLSRDTLASINCIKMLGVNVNSLDSGGNHPRILGFDKLENQQSQTMNMTKNDATGLVGTQDLFVESNGGRRGFKTPNDVLNADNSGTTIRITTSMCSLVSEGYSILTGDKSLRKRPMGDLIKALNQLGVDCFSTNDNYFPPLVVKGGGIKGGTTKISGKVSSQFMSSILISGIYSEKPITIHVLGNQVSKPYIDSTLFMMKKFGIRLENSAHGDVISDLEDRPDESKELRMDQKISEEYRLPCTSEYKPQTFQVPGDFSTAALLLSAAILSEGVLVIKNLDFTMPQGDMEIIKIIKKMGGKMDVDEGNGIVKVDGSIKLDGGDFNLLNTPDLLPVVAILSLKAKEKTTITGVSHARYKETDRVSIISSQLAKFGAQIKEDTDSLTIYPPDKLKNAVINSFDDHRLFMAFTIAGLSTEHSIIDSADSVDVSYPNFIRELKGTGAKIEQLE